MAGRMPVLRGEGVAERAGEQAADRGHHRIAVRHRQLAAGHESGLHVDQAENVVLRIDGDAGHARWSLGVACGAAVLSGKRHHCAATQRQHSGARALQT